jgi:3,4-dihydroxy 2-butanone 4-phosphate synthase/GTP cyclohydrolase II
MIVPIPEAIEIVRRGQVIILVDDEDRENEGDFVCAAECCTPEIVNFMSKFGRGLMCVPMTEERLAALNLPLMVRDNTALHGTNFTVSVDAVRNVSTGISAADRAETIRVLTDPSSRPEDLGRPGHVFPICARPGGVLERAGHTEASVDLARLAGFSPTGVLIEILNDDGSMARLPDLESLAKKHDVRISTIRDLIAYRIQNEVLVERVAVATLPNRFGTWTMLVYESNISGEIHTALVMGDPAARDAALVRVHSQCFTGDTLGSLRCDCGPQLEKAMEAIAREGDGVVLYMAQEGRGIGLKNKIRAYALQDQGKDTVEANEALGFKDDLRDYGIGAQILRDLGLRRLRLMTNNPRKIVGLEALDRVQIETSAHDVNRRYLAAKKTKLGHLLEDV